MERDAVDALRRMGVAAGDARRAVASACAAEPGCIEELLRRALKVLRETVYACRAREPVRRYGPGAIMDLHPILHSA